MAIGIKVGTFDGIIKLLGFQHELLKGLPRQQPEEILERRNQVAVPEARRVAEAQPVFRAELFEPLFRKPGQTGNDDAGAAVSPVVSSVFEGGKEARNSVKLEEVTCAP